MIRANGRARLPLSVCYLSITSRVALPPAALRAVMIAGFDGKLRLARYLPPPVFVKVPMVWFVDVTKTVNVVFRFVLVASTRSSRLAASYSARVTLTVSDAGGGVGFTVKLALRVTPPAVPLTVTTAGAVTWRVVMLNVCSTEPAEIVAVAGTLTTAVLLLLSCTTTLPAGAPAPRLTMPCAVVPPVTGEGAIVIPASCPLDSCGKRGSTTTILGLQCCLC
jgi:hypothetical protein